MNKSLILISLFLLFASSGCGIYSFSGASISPDVKTISIQPFIDEVGAGPANMSQVFTEAIKDYFQQNTNLTLVAYEGDLQLEGSITGYDIAPMSPSAGGNQQFPDADVAAQQRLTIRVSASYTNTKDGTFNFEDKPFSFYLDYDPETQDLSSNEDQFVEEIIDQIVVDIFNASIANW